MTNLDPIFQLISAILKENNRRFISRDVFVRFLQADLRLLTISRVEIEDCINSLCSNGLITIISEASPFQFAVTTPELLPSVIKKGPLTVRDVLDKGTFDELTNVFRSIEEGDRIYFSAHAGTTVIDYFGKELENCLLKPNVKLCLMMLGSLSDPLLKEIKSDKFDKLVENAKQSWYNIQRLAGPGKVEIRQSQGLAGINRCIIVTDKTGNIKYCAFFSWHLGKRGADDGVYISSYSSDLSTSKLFLDDFLKKWSLATSYNCRVFICHSAKDKRFCRTLVGRLKDDGFPVWFDEMDILPGEDFIDKMEYGIRVSDYIAVVLSQNFLKGSWAQKEYKTALEKEVKSKRIRVIPVYKSNIPLESFPEFLKTKNYADFRQNFQSGYKQLVLSLKNLPLKQFMSL